MIALDSVMFRYKEEHKPVLDGLSLTIHPGQMLAVMGSNGSGKSTLARLLNGLLVPQAGSVLVDGLDTRQEQANHLIKVKVGIVFQNPDNQMVAPTVEDDIAFGLENLGIDAAEIKRRVNRVLRDMRIEALASAAPDSLSGGEKQRVAIAGILVMQPKYLVLDEAGSMLDPRSRRDLLQIVLELKRQGMGIVLITQQPEEALAADQLVILDQGAVARQGRPVQILSCKPEMLNAYGLHTTVMGRLAYKLRAHGMDLPGHILTVEDMVESLC